MNTPEQRNFVIANYSEELNEVQNAFEIVDYREVESIIDIVNNPVFTRYCVTLLIDELISFETKDLS